MENSEKERETERQRDRDRDRDRDRVCVCVHEHVWRRGAQNGVTSFQVTAMQWDYRGQAWIKQCGC